MTSRESLIIGAEQALLGSVLCDPRGQGHVLDLAGPDDFWRPYHGQVFSAMQRVRARSRLPGPQEVYREIGGDPDLPREIAGNAALLADLMQSVPRPDHASVYLGMVIGGGVRRRIALVASRMQQSAADGDLAAAVRMTSGARQEIGRCQDRWLALPVAVRREPSTVPIRGGAAAAAAAAHAADDIRQLRRELLAGGGEPPQRRLAIIAQRVACIAEASAELHHGASAGESQQDDPKARQAEGMALRHLIAGPSQIHPIGRWLRDSHFTDARHRAVYCVVRDLAAGGHPVDPLTVAWEAARSGIPVEMADLSDGTAPFAMAAARDVARHGMLTNIGKAGREIQASATSHQITTGLLLRRAGQRLQDLQREWPQPSVEPAQPIQAQNLCPRGPARSAGQAKEATA